MTNDLAAHETHRISCVDEALLVLDRSVAGLGADRSVNESFYGFHVQLGHTVDPMDAEAGGASPPAATATRRKPAQGATYRDPAEDMEEPRALEAHEMPRLVEDYARAARSARSRRRGVDRAILGPLSSWGVVSTRPESATPPCPERPTPVQELRLPTGVVDFARREVRFDDGDRCQLSERETGLLDYLVGNPGRAISREELLRRVWRIEAKGVETRTIDMHVARLREKLRDGPGDPQLLVTVRGKGYMFSGSEVPL